MIRVDDVYQKVLALANKEQRGYITPQDFNLFANQAQLEIFEQYFYDIEQFERSPSSDMDDLIKQKTQIFKKFSQTVNHGDTIHKFTTATGIHSLAQLGAKAVGKKDCGCKKRQEALNKAFPYKK